MATIEVFNELLVDFVNNLAKTYSHVAALQLVPAQLKLAIKTNPTQIHAEFMKCVSPYYEDISKRNDDFFTGTVDEIDILKAADFKNNWEQSPQDTKDSIWDYLYNLMIIGKSINVMPSDLMANISAFVETYTTNNQGTVDIGHLINSLQHDETMSKIFSDTVQGGTNDCK